LEEKKEGRQLGGTQVSKGGFTMTIDRGNRMGIRSAGKFQISKQWSGEEKKNFRRTKNQRETKHNEEEK